jgi:V/A-type H+/Na+-transporting ATPase subunit E
MAYENLLKSVEESAQERERDLREKARKAVQAISEDTRSQASAIQQSFLEEAKKTAAIEKNKSIYITKGENKEKLIKTKEKIYSTAFSEAEQRLLPIRKNPEYPAILKNLTREAIGAIGQEEFLVHIDKQDEQLIGGILSDLNSHAKIIPDLHCSGGLVVSTPNGSIKISNTIESRLERAREQKKLQIYAVLYGD